VAEELYEPCAEVLRQGDIFEPLSFLRAEPSQDGNDLRSVASSRPQLALLLNQSCDIDKPNFTRLIVAPVVQISGLKSVDQTRVRKNEIYSRLHLPAYRSLLPESFVSFLEPMTVDKEFLRRAPRVISLSEQGRRALYVQYVRWLTRWSLVEIQCPTCDVIFSPAQTLPVVND
jgi:hypothetical protein